MARSVDSFYVRDCQQIQSGTVAVQNLAGQISRQMHLVESDHDLSEIQGLIDRAVGECEDIQLLLKRFQEYTSGGATNEHSSRKMMQQTLSDNVSITARVLEDIIQNFLTLWKERQLSEPEDSSYLLSAAVDATLEGKNLGAEEARVNGNNEYTVVAGVTVDELEKQRQESISKVECDMVALKQIYTDLNQTAASQQEYFDSIESHLLESGQYSRSAVSEFLVSDNRVGNKWKRRYKGAAVALGILIALYFFVLVPT
eukprot:GEMP01035462.1.p1 GENE.GEMP01035462.1~~GEMP01035462.1.p1  ORF type:complete len:257 (+),score=59.16 GEMP01035462.1:75-845(+)